MLNNSDRLILRKAEPLRPFLSDPKASEIVINCQGEIWVEYKEKGWKVIKEPEITESWAFELGNMLANKSGMRGFRDIPFIPAELPEGHRIQICCGDMIESKIAIAIRLSRKTTFTLDDFELEKLGKTANETDINIDNKQELKKLLIDAIKAKANILVSGATNSGKTQFLNALLKEIPTDDRVITVEDTREIQIPHIKNKVHFKTTALDDEEIRGQLNKIMDAILRLRPDRIFCGEIRSNNGASVIRMLNNGHKGFVSTIHADSPRKALERLTDYIRTQKTPPPIDVVNKQVKEGLDVVVQLSRAKNSDKRVVSDILWSKNFYDAVE
ncbi:MAG: ATPase, T2SS/T4P/T4SS family [Bacilli bacterium]